METRRAGGPGWRLSYVAGIDAASEAEEAP
jgi:hypothetical protein